MSFINKYSFKCLLGPRSKDVEIKSDIYTWKVNSKQHFATSKILTENDLSIINNIAPSNFHYLSPENCEFLKKSFTVKRSKKRSIVLDIQNSELKGKKYKKIRQAFNKCSKNDFELLDNYKNFDDVLIMIKEWSNEYTDKYFRDFSGKTTFFYKNNSHNECINLFIYDQERLVSFGSLSPPDKDHSAYIVGKALFKRYPGLSEYTDLILYKKALNEGIRYINMGGSSSKDLLFYKLKFPNSKEEICYDGKIEV